MAGTVPEPHKLAESSIDILTEDLSSEQPAWWRTRLRQVDGRAPSQAPDPRQVFSTSQLSPIADERPLSTLKDVRTVPVYVAELFWPRLDEDQRSRLRTCGRVLGARPEVDLEAVAAGLGSGVAQAMADHYRLCASGEWLPYSHSVVTMRRPLRLAVQSTAKANRSDLVDEYEALCGVPGVCELIEELTGPEPADARLDLLGSPFIFETRSEGATRASRFSVESAFDWLPVLGGPSSVGEQRRIFEVGTNYATWRDRRVRRLERIRVTAEECWPAAPAL